MDTPPNLACPVHIHHDILFYVHRLRPELNCLFDLLFSFGRSSVFNHCGGSAGLFQDTHLSTLQLGFDYKINVFLTAPPSH